MTDDDVLLFWIAQAYHREFWKEQKPPALRPLIRKTLGTYLREGPSAEERRGEQKSKDVERLAEKFNKDRDHLIQRAIGTHDLARIDSLDRVRDLIREMRKLGIKVDETPASPKRGRPVRVKATK